MKKIVIVFAVLFLIGCRTTLKQHNENKNNFKQAYDFLKKYHSDLVLLQDTNSNAKIIILPGYQGRVMTSTAEGDTGESYGWINYDLIASQKLTHPINAFGGEERFWMGPEGGQFSLFFKKGTPFTFDNWQVPKEFDTDKFDVVYQSNNKVTFEKNLQLENYSGTKFEVKVDRTISLITKLALEKEIGKIGDSIQVVAFESNNQITNIGSRAWTTNTGMLSIWILSMLNATDQTTIIAPFKKGDSTQLGKIVTDDYFGKVPSDRLKVQDSFLLFKADAAYRSKIGLSPKRAIPWIASYDKQKNLLTIAQFSLHRNNNAYVNSTWKIQDQPFSGDAVNAYNDGPIDHQQIGKFYEIESSSPAAALAPGEKMQHLHKTIHFKGSPTQLNKISIQLLGVGLETIQ